MNSTELKVHVKICGITPIGTEYITSKIAKEKINETKQNKKLLGLRRKQLTTKGNSTNGHVGDHFSSLAEGG